MKQKWFFNKYKNAYEYSIYENAKFGAQRKFLDAVENNIKRYCNCMLNFRKE